MLQTLVHFLWDVRAGDARAGGDPCGSASSSYYDTLAIVAASSATSTHKRPSDVSFDWSASEQFREAPGHQQLLFDIDLD